MWFITVTNTKGCSRQVPINELANLFEELFPRAAVVATDDPMEWEDKPAEPAPVVEEPVFGMDVVAEDFVSP